MFSKLKRRQIPEKLTLKTTEFCKLIPLVEICSRAGHMIGHVMNHVRVRVRVITKQ